MGLAIEVGILSDLVGAAEDEIADVRAELDGLSAALAAEGVVWSEPEGVLVPPTRADVASFPYSWLHYLRRVLALVTTRQVVTPVDGSDAVDRDRQRVDDVTMMYSSHLLCHSDCEGYYVPVAFATPLFLPEDSGVVGGGMVGSSQGLLAELRWCAPAIGIELAADQSLSDAEAQRLAELPDTADFAIESTVWLALHEACEASIASGCAIVFN
jgi:hypothetical protein